MDHPMMKCGCVASGHTLNTKKPVCVTCYGLTPDAEEVDTSFHPSMLNGRTAECSYCGRREPSGTHLAFFVWRKDATHDLFYCGCRGWD